MAYIFSNTVHEGQLKKQGGRLRTWKTRWFVLTEDKRMRYFSCQDKKRLIAEFSLKGHELYVIPNDALDTQTDQRYLFEIRSGDGTRLTESHDSFLLWASSEEEREEWVFVLKKILYRERGGAVFGYSLSETMAVDGRHNYFVPRIVQELVEFIYKEGTELEGIFRLSGRKKLIRQLIDDYDRGKKFDHAEKGVDVHTAACVLKDYLRRLPQPLIPFDRFEEMSTYGSKLSLSLPEMDDIYDLVRKGLNSLPVWNYNLLKYLINFLVHIASKADINKMSAANLAAIHAPNILRLENENAELMATVNMVVVETTMGFINNYDTLFTREYSCGDLLQLDTPDPSPAQKRSDRLISRNPKSSQTSEGSTESMDSQKGRNTVCPIADEKILPTSDYFEVMSENLKQLLSKEQTLRQNLEDKLIIADMRNGELLARSKTLEQEKASLVSREQELAEKVRVLEHENAGLLKKLEKYAKKAGTLA